MTILYFIVALGILVLVHEWGHFIVARLSGIRVEQFSIGFGPKIFSFKRGQTEYRIAWIPLGGYVKLYGEDPMAEADGDIEKAKEIEASPEAFSSKSLKARLATVFAGPAMNLVLCLILMPIVFMVGRMVPAILEKPPVVIGVQEGSPAAIAGLQEGDKIISIDGRSMPVWSDFLNWVMLHSEVEATVVFERNGKRQETLLKTTLSPHVKQSIGYSGIEPFFFWGDNAIVGSVNGNSPAAKAGLQEKDKIIAIDGNPVKSWTVMTELIRGSEGKELQITLLRDGQQQQTRIAPMYHDGAQAWIIGITKYMDPSRYVSKRYGFFTAIKEGTKENWKLLKLTGDVLGRLFTFQLSYKSLGGPVQIAKASGAAARSGLGDFLFFMAFLSMQLGILNLLPIPVLDGGHVLFMGIEAIRKKPVSIRARTISTQIGLAFLLGLMLLVTVNDIDMVWGFSNMWESIKGIF